MTGQHDFVISGVTKLAIPAALFSAQLLRIYAHWSCSLDSATYMVLLQLVSLPQHLATLLVHFLLAI